MILYGKNFLIFDRLLEDIGKYRHHLPYRVQTFYIPLEDDTLIAADVVTEKGSIIARPSFLLLGCRWNQKDDFRRLNPIIHEGFNLVKIDLRGIGASTGTRTLPWIRSEIDDIHQIINWIIHQPWSDGNIVTFGDKYSSTTSELSASLNSDSIKANIIFGNPFNLYSEFFFPGGLFLEYFSMEWDQYLQNIEQKNIKPVNDPIHRADLVDIKRQHQWNTRIFNELSQIDFSDDKFPSKPDISIENISVFHYSNEIARNKHPKFIVGSWFGGKSATSVIHRFQNYSGPMICVIGSWDHNLRSIKHIPNIKPNSIPSELVLILEYIRFAKLSISNPTNIPKLLYYFTIGEQKWKVTDQWPIPDIKVRQFFFAPKHRLVSQPTDNKGEKTEYRINYKVTSGRKNRWNTLFGNPIDYGNRATQDRKLLTFTTTNFTEPMEITGHPEVTLHLSSNLEDGGVFVYLEAIHKRKIYYLSEGQLRLLFWKVSKSSPYKTPILHRNFFKSEIEKLRPHIIYDIRIPLEPISVQLPSDTKLRVTIAGVDVGNFSNYPKELESPGIWNFYHNTEFSSSISLPIRKVSKGKNEE